MATNTLTLQVLNINNHIESFFIVVIVNCRLTPNQDYKKERINLSPNASDIQTRDLIKQSEYFYRYANQMPLTLNLNNTKTHARALTHV